MRPRGAADGRGRLLREDVGAPQAPLARGQLHGAHEFREEPGALAGGRLLRVGGRRQQHPLVPRGAAV